MEEKDLFEKLKAAKQTKISKQDDGSYLLEIFDGKKWEKTKARSYDHARRAITQAKAHRSNDLNSFAKRLSRDITTIKVEREH